MLWTIQTIQLPLQVRIPITPAFTAIVTGHGKTRAYLHRFGFIDSPMCPCKGGEQTSEHLIYHCNILKTQREIMKRRIKKSGGTWPTTNKVLIAKHLSAFTNFISSIDFDKPN